jgi:hypothetical protein
VKGILHVAIEYYRPFIGVVAVHVPKPIIARVVPAANQHARSFRVDRIGHVFIAFGLSVFLEDIVALCDSLLVPGIARIERLDDAANLTICKLSTAISVDERAWSSGNAGSDGSNSGPSTYLGCGGGGTASTSFLNDCSHRFMTATQRSLSLAGHKSAAYPANPHRSQTALY